MPDREKLIELIANLLRKEFGDNFVFTREYAKYGGYSGYKEHYVYDIAKKIADYLMANGGVIRKKGEWIEKKHNDGYGEYSLFHCSKCDAPTAQKTRNFCINCGADLRGE